MPTSLVTGTTSATNTSRPGEPGTGDYPDLERALTRVARAILRLDVPRRALADGEVVDRAGYWLMVRVSESELIRLSELAGLVALDVSTVSRQIRDLVASGLVEKLPDPDDGRAALLRLTPRGSAVLESVSEARQHVLAEALAGWTGTERDALAAAVRHLADALADGSAG